MAVEGRNLVVDYGKVRALDNVSFEAADSEFLVILGLRVSGVCHSERNIAMVFQNYAIYPHMTVHDNIALNMRMKSILSNVINGKVEEVAEMLLVADHLNKRLIQLSGGQSQRAGLARAMVREPVAFLMDEQLSSLDAELRNEMRDEMKIFQELTHKTIIYVTQDQIEAMTQAMTLGDRIVVMNKGRVILIGSPKEMFDNPEHLFIAGFLDNPPMNLIPAQVIRKAAGSYSVSFGNGASTTLALDGSYGTLPASVTIGMKPTDFIIDPSGPLSPLFDRCELPGAEMNVYFEICESKCIARLCRDETNEPLLSMNRRETVKFNDDGNRIYMFDPNTCNRISPSSGQST